MGLFKEKLCVHCGNKAGMLRSTLVDGQYICSKCTKPIPLELSKFLNEYDYEGFKNLLEYLKTSETEYKQSFRETHHFHALHLDTEHGLFYLDNIFPRVYFSLDQVKEFKLDFRPETIKEGLLGEKVTGNIYMKLSVEFPYMFMDSVFANNVKASATTKGVFNKKVVYDNPKGMDDFYYAFLSSWESALLARAKHYEQLTEELRQLREGMQETQ